MGVCSLQLKQTSINDSLGNALQFCEAMKLM
jgi:hypothetical protein